MPYREKKENEELEQATLWGKKQKERNRLKERFKSMEMKDFTLEKDYHRIH